VARTVKFQVECMACKGQTDYTDQMVLENLIMGLANEEIKRKVLATPETTCTLAKVLRFVEAEESGKYSLSDSELFNRMSVMSTLKSQQQQGGVVRQPEVNPLRATPRPCNNCGMTHMEFRSGGSFPAYNTK
jgi:hypothetical protein